MSQIDKVVFGDSYCSIQLRKNIQRSWTLYGILHATYLDIFAEKHNLEIVPQAHPHGPIWMLHEFREWLKSKRQEEINPNTFCFS